jgi:hypothetical protein
VCFVLLGFILLVIGFQTGAFDRCIRPGFRGIRHFVAFDKKNGAFDTGGGAFDISLHLTCNVAHSTLSAHSTQSVGAFDLSIGAFDGHGAFDPLSAFDTVVGAFDLLTISAFDLGRGLFTNKVRLTFAYVVSFLGLV